MAKHKRKNRSRDVRGFSVDEAAQYLGVGRTTVYKLIAESELRSFQIGRSRRVTRDACDEYIERQEAKAA